MTYNVILPTEDEIVSSWNNSSKVMVSIICTTFNHEDFVSEAIDSFLEQKTEYSFEIIIHDDASSDNTVDIIDKYKKKYPLIIKTIYQTDNQYIKGKKPINLAYPLCSGKYIAICEGDDFWDDKRKLQKQITFLEKHKEYFVSHHNAYYVRDGIRNIHELKVTNKLQCDFSQDALVKGRCFLPTLSLVFRNEIKLDNIPELDSVVNYDYFLISLLGLYGKSKYHNDINPGGYRVHGGGVWSLLDKDKKNDQFTYTCFALFLYHKRNKTGYSDYFAIKNFQLWLKRMFFGKLWIKAIYFIIENKTKKIFGK